jgi:hypothetical protein
MPDQKLPPEEEKKINLTFRTREERERNRIDIVRFEHHEEYKTEDDLKWFKDEHLKELFVKIFWDKPGNVTEILNEAVEIYPEDKTRILQIRELLIKLKE